MKLKYHKYVRAVLMIGVITFSNFGCKRFVEVEPPIDKATAQSVFDDAITASAALSNIYYMLYRNVTGGTNGASIMCGLASDELILQDESNIFLHSLFSNSLSSIGSFELDAYWITCYNVIFRINSVIEGVTTSKGIPDNFKNELVGQAKFLRAYLYFYLVNLYGGVPIVTGTDYKVNMLMPRSNENQVYEQIIHDLTDSQALVNQDYLKPDLINVSDERVTANKAVVKSLLARVYLYTKQWQKAEDAASQVISDQRYVVSIPLNSVFLKNSSEAIWQIEGDILKGDNSVDGSFFIPIQGEVPKIYLSESLLSEIRSDDERRKDWLEQIVIGGNTFFYPFKYKNKDIPGNVGVTTEYNMLLRLAEQYLIRAEARANLSKIAGAIEDVNVIRKRAGVPLYINLDQRSLLIAIEKERQVELFSESGHRWFDLKRTGRADVVLGSLKGSDWQATDKLFPIPSDEFLRNPNLRGHQNPGYTEQ